MKLSTAIGLLLMTTTLLQGADPFAPAENSDGDAKVKAATSPVEEKVEGWGKGENPDGDCKFFVKGKELLIHVPGSTPGHDLAAEINVLNAPRVLQPVKGNFAVQVCVEGRFAPGGESTLSGRTGYNGAALVLLGDTNNVVSLARAVLQRPDGNPTPYANFEIRVGGQVQRLGDTDDQVLPLSGRVHLRLERRGQKVLGAVSLDGEVWTVLEPKILPATWPDEVQVGVVAISTSKEEFNPRFSKLEILK